MGKVDEIAQRIDGTMDELKGNIQQNQGDTIKGGMTKMQGKLKKATAPLQNADDRDTDTSL